MSDAPATFRPSCVAHGKAASCTGKSLVGDATRLKSRVGKKFSLQPRLTVAGWICLCHGVAGTLWLVGTVGPPSPLRAHCALCCVIGQSLQLIFALRHCIPKHLLQPSNLNRARHPNRTSFLACGLRTADCFVHLVVLSDSAKYKHQTLFDYS